MGSRYRYMGIENIPRDAAYSSDRTHKNRDELTWIICRSASDNLKNQNIYVSIIVLLEYVNCFVIVDFAISGKVTITLETR